MPSFAVEFAGGGGPMTVHRLAALARLFNRSVRGGGPTDAATATDDLAPTAPAPAPANRQLPEPFVKELDGALRASPVVAAALHRPGSDDAGPAPEARAAAQAGLRDSLNDRARREREEADRYAAFHPVVQTLGSAMFEWGSARAYVAKDAEAHAAAWQEVEKSKDASLESLRARLAALDAYVKAYDKVSPALLQTPFAQAGTFAEAYAVAVGAAFEALDRWLTPDDKQRWDPPGVLQLLLAILDEPQAFLAAMRNPDAAELADGDRADHYAKAAAVFASAVQTVTQRLGKFKERFKEAWDQVVASDPKNLNLQPLIALAKEDDDELGSAADDATAEGTEPLDQKMARWHTASETASTSTMQTAEDDQPEEPQDAFTRWFAGLNVTKSNKPIERRLLTEEEFKTWLAKVTVSVEGDVYSLTGAGMPVTFQPGGPFKVYRVTALPTDIATSDQPAKNVIPAIVMLGNLIHYKEALIQYIQEKTGKTVTSTLLPSYISLRYDEAVQTGTVTANHRYKVSDIVKAITDL